MSGAARQQPLRVGGRPACLAGARCRVTAKRFGKTVAGVGRAAGVWAEVDETAVPPAFASAHRPVCRARPVVGAGGRIRLGHNDAGLVAGRPMPLPVVLASKAAPKEVVYATAAAPVVGLTAKLVLSSHAQPTARPA